MKRGIKLNKRFISFFLTLMMIYSMAFTGIKVSAATGLTISVNDSSNQSIPQYTNSGGNSTNKIFSNPVRLAANANAKISYNFTNANMAKYQFVKASDLTTVPQFPQDSTMTNINLPAPNSYDAYANDIGNKGTISTMQYVYAGNPDTASSSARLTRDVSFGTPLSSTMLVQNAIQGSDIPNYTVSGSTAFLPDTTVYTGYSQSKTSMYYVWNPFSYYYMKPSKNAAWKAMKFWGYFSPQQTGYYKLGANSDDGAYGYLMVNGQKQVFVNDWSINSAFNRNTNNPVYLSANSYYPIYMEWYEGCPTNAAFTPVYQYSSNSSTSGFSNWANIPQDYFYSSKTTTPGTIPGAYFGDVSGIPFPTQDGIYYIATKFVSGEGTTSGLYGPFIIDKTPPTISNLSVISDYSSDKKKAGVGNTLTITFKASETLQANPQISLDGYVANVITYTKDSNNNYTATVKIAEDGSINSSGDKITQIGSINVKISSYSDLSGNVGLPVQDSSVTFINATGITLTLTTNTTALTNGNVIITANAIASGSGNSIKTIKYAAGNQSVNYFTAGGTSIYDSSISGSKSTVQSTFNVNTNGVYTVYSTDSNGNVALQTIDIENIFVAKPVITSPTTGTVTNNNTPAITGTAVANSTVKVYDGATLIGTVNVDGSGNWTLIPAEALSDGTHTITATATDAAGNVSAASNTVNITIDTEKPTITLTPSTTLPTKDNVTVTANITDNIGVTVTKWASGNQIAAYFASGSVGNSLSGNTFPVSENGIYTVYAKDAAGNETVQTITISNIDKIAPTIVLSQSPAADVQTKDNVTVTANITDNVGVTVTKWAIGNQTADYFASGSVGNSLSENTFPVSKNGIYTVYAKDAAGNETVQTIDVENIFVAAPVITAPTTGTVTNNNTPAIMGTAAANSTVKVYDGATLIGTVNVDGSGNWTLIPAEALSDGTHTITATATDAAGNVSAASNTVNITIDTEKPTITLTPSTTLPTKDNVTVTANITDNVGVTVTKWASGNQTAAYFASGSVGNSLSGNTFPVSENGIYTVYARDAAGNETVQTITISNIDKIAPTIVLSQSPAADVKTKDNVTVTANITDNVGVTVTKWASGNQTAAYFASGSVGNSLSENTFLVSENGTYTVYARDAAGNESIQTIDITNIRKLEANLTLKKELTKDAFVGKQFEIKYTITPNEIEAYPNDVNPEKLVVNNLGFSECLPAGLILDETKIDTDKLNVTLNGNTLSGTIVPAITYTLDSAKAKYTAQPISFSIWVTSNSVNTYNMSSENSYINYTDVDNVTKKANFNDLNIVVNGYSRILSHGIYSGSGSNIISDNDVFAGIPVTLAMKVDIESSNPSIKWNASDNAKISEQTIVFKKYLLNDDDSIANTSPEVVQFSNNGDINITGLTTQVGKKYLITYTVTPVGSGTNTITATGEDNIDKRVALNIGAIPSPDLF